MSKSSKVTKAHNEKALLKNLETLSTHEKERVISILSLMVDESRGLEPMITITINRDGLSIYRGQSISTALAIYTQLLEQSIRATEWGTTLNLEFYATNKDSSITLLGGA